MDNNIIRSWTVSNLDLPGNVLRGKNKTFLEDLAEYSARICYQSDDSMGKSDNFLSARIKEGHMDVFEHSRITLDLDTGNNLTIALDWMKRLLFSFHDNGSLNYFSIFYTPEKNLAITGHLRSWYDLHTKWLNTHFPHTKDSEKLIMQLKRTIIPLKMLAPKTFVGIEHRSLEKDGFSWDHPEKTNLRNDFYVYLNQEPLNSVTLLGANIPRGEDYFYPDSHISFTFLIEHVSRALTHQLVRHRRGSFSQESQRYVDLERADWEIVTPIGLDQNQKEIYVGVWDTLKHQYRRLREAGLRKEDARFVLPNMVETKLVVTMSLADWKHFLWMRALDKAAQWEIRGVGQQILECITKVNQKLVEREVEFYEENLEELTRGVVR